MKQYQVVNETSYDERTSTEVIQVLERARQSRIRLHISLGETEGQDAGRDWLEEFETYGYVGRSMGLVKVPLMIANGRSTGGGAILDHCIVRIRESADGRVLYRHPQYHHGELQIRQKANSMSMPDGRKLTVDVFRDGEVHASFEDMAKARRWIHKLGLTAPITA